MTKIKAVIFDYDGVLTHWLRKDETLFAFAATLRSQGYITGILSNQYRPVAAIVRRLDHVKDFDPVIISCEVGTAKPRPDIYRLLLDALRLPAEACLFIDNRRRNVRTADSLGLRTVLAKNTEQIMRDVKAIIDETSVPVKNS